MKALFHWGSVRVKHIIDLRRFSTVALVKLGIQRKAVAWITDSRRRQPCLTTTVFITLNPYNASKPFSRP